MKWSLTSCGEKILDAAIMARWNFDFPVSDFVSVHDRQQGRSEQHAPERNYYPEHDGCQNRGPHRHLGRAPHDVWLKQKSVDYNDRGVEDEHIERVFPIAPPQGRSKYRTDHPQYRPKVRHKLQNSSQQSPERCPWNFHNPQTDQPEDTDRERILKLRENPLLQRSAGDVKMLSEFHLLLDASGTLRATKLRSVTSLTCVTLSPEIRFTVNRRRTGRSVFLFMLDSNRSQPPRRKMKFGVIIFPSSNCDHDAYWTIQQVAKQPVTFLWHESHDLENCDVIIVPGGFAYGDYLRTGAIAKLSPVMQSVRQFAAGGGVVLGICNGFQILCESGLLPGALMRNVGLNYVCNPVQLRVENAETPFTSACHQGEELSIPVGHMEGNYFCDDATLTELRRDNRIVFRYSTPTGDITREANPNGSLDNIAGICSPGRNVVGMMPHPERASEAELGWTEGLKSSHA